jgi:ribonuclease P protein component
MATAPRYTLGSDSRLKREQHIEKLFRTGKAFSVFPIRLTWTLTPRGEEASRTRAGFSVSKKKFKRSIDRGRVKRLLREAWRLQQHELSMLIPEGKQLHLFLVFTDATLPEYKIVFEAVGKALVKLKKALSDA